MTRTTMSLFSIVLALVTPLPGAASETISLDEFLAVLRENHPVFTSERLAVDIAEETRAGLIGAQDWQLFSSATIMHERATAVGLGPERTTAIVLGGGAERVIWETGGRFRAAASLTRADLTIDPLLGYPEDYYESEVGVSYVHPLIRNKGGALDRLEYDLAEYEALSAETAAVEGEEEFLAAAAAKFLDWVFLTEQIEIVDERLGLSERELARAVRKRDAYLIDEADVIRAEDAVRFWEQTLALSRSRWAALQAELAVLAQDEAITEASPVYDLYGLTDLPSLSDASSTLLRDSRLLRELKLRLEQLHHARLGFEETAKPDLVLVTEFAARGAEEELRESLVLDKPDWTVSLQYAFPLKNTTARSNVARTDLEIQRLETMTEGVALNLLSGLYAIHTQMTLLDSVLALNREQMESARRRTEEELSLYNHGRGELTFVIQSRDNEQQARQTRAENALAYHKLLLAYRAITDDLHKAN